MSEITKTAPFTLKDVFLAPLSEDYSFAIWEKPQYTVYPHEMQFPVCNGLSGGGFYEEFWPELWSTAVEKIAAKNRDVSEDCDGAREPGPTEIWGSKLLSPPRIECAQWRYGREKIEVREVGRLPGWGVDDIPRNVAMLDRALSGHTNCMANYLPQPMVVSVIRRVTGIAIPDIYFSLVRQWYLGELTLDEIKPAFDACEAYFDFFGEGEEGWRSFACQNYLSGSFIDEDYQPVKLFDYEDGLVSGFGMLSPNQFWKLVGDNVGQIAIRFLDCLDKRAEVLAQAYSKIWIERLEAVCEAAKKLDWDDSEKAKKTLEDTEEFDRFWDIDDLIKCMSDDMHFEGDLVIDLALACGSEVAAQIAFEDLRRFSWCDNDYAILLLYDIQPSLEDVASLEDLEELIGKAIDSDSRTQVYLDIPCGKYRIRGTHGCDPLTYIASDFSRTCLYFPHAYVGEKPKMYDGKECWPCHHHDFNSVLRAVLNNPDTFWIPDDCKQYYSEQELDLIEKFKSKLLENASTSNQTN